MTARGRRAGSLAMAAVASLLFLSLCAECGSMVSQETGTGRGRGRGGGGAAAAAAEAAAAGCCRRSNRWDPRGVLGTAGGGHGGRRLGLMTMRMRGGMGMLGKFTGDMGNLDRTQRMAEQRRMEDGEEMKREREREAREREEEEARRERRDDVDERAMRTLSRGDDHGKHAQRMGGQPSRRTSQQGQERGEGRLSGQAKQGGAGTYEEPEWGGTPVPGAMIAELRECEAGRVLRVMELNQQSFFKVGRDSRLVDIVLEHATVSRVHCVLQMNKQAMCWIYDLGSGHGTAVNGRAVLPGQHKMLVPGDKVTFARCTRVYEYETRMCRSLGEDDDERRRRREEEEDVMEGGEGGKSNQDDKIINAALNLKAQGMLSTGELQEVGLLEAKLKIISVEVTKMRKLSESMERGGDPADGKPQRILKLQMKVEKLKDGLKPILKRLKRWVLPMTEPRGDGGGEDEGEDIGGEGDTEEDGSSSDGEGGDSYIEDSPENIARIKADHDRLEAEFEACVRNLEEAEVKLGVMLRQRQEMEMEERRKEDEDEGGSGRRRRRRRKVPDTLGSLEGLERGMRDDGEFGDDDGLDEGGGGGGGGGRISMESSVLTSRIVAQKDMLRRLEEEKKNIKIELDEAREVLYALPEDDYLTPVELSSKAGAGSGGGGSGAKKHAARRGYAGGVGGKEKGEEGGGWLVDGDDDFGGGDDDLDWGRGEREYTRGFPEKYMKVQRAMDRLEGETWTHEIEGWTGFIDEEEPLSDQIVPLTHDELEEYRSLMPEYTGSALLNFSKYGQFEKYYNPNPPVFPGGPLDPGTPLEHIRQRKLVKLGHDLPEGLHFKVPGGGWVRAVVNKPRFNPMPDAEEDGDDGRILEDNDVLKSMGSAGGGGDQDEEQGRAERFLGGEDRGEEGDIECAGGTEGSVRGRPSDGSRGQSKLAGGEEVSETAKNGSRKRAKWFEQGYISVWALDGRKPPKGWHLMSGNHGLGFYRPSAATGKDASNQAAAGFEQQRRPEAESSGYGEGYDMGDDDEDDGGYGGGGAKDAISLDLGD